MWEAVRQGLWCRGCRGGGGIVWEAARQGLWCRGGWQGWELIPGLRVK